MSKKKQMRDKASLEDIYCNKLFVPPKEQNLETIFEEPRQSKDGVPILTSVKKYKRYLHFDPTQNKIQKRKRKAKKCAKKLRTNYRVTRSSPENSKCDDVCMYIFDVIGDTSSDSDMADASIIAQKTFTNTVGVKQSPSAVQHPASLCENESCTNLCDTPKRNYHELKSRFMQETKMPDSVCENPEAEAAIKTSHTDAEKSDTKHESDESLESPRRLPEKSTEILVM